jgi:hypothetical protein
MPGMAMKRDLTPQQLRAREMMKHVHPAYDRATVDFDRIARTGILCVECKACGKRAALTKENCTHIHPGNKTEVRSVTFRCSRIDCGSTDVRRYGGCDLEEAKMGLAGDPMDPEREIRGCTQPLQLSWIECHRIPPPGATDKLCRPGTRELTSSGLGRYWRGCQIARCRGLRRHRHQL